MRSSHQSLLVRTQADQMEAINSRCNTVGPLQIMDICMGSKVSSRYRSSRCLHSSSICNPLSQIFLTANNNNMEYHRCTNNHFTDKTSHRDTLSILGTRHK